MEIQYVHVKTRSQFGKQCIFDDEGPTTDENILPDRELMNDYIYRNPCHVGVQNSKQFAVHEVETTSAPMKESGMAHTEGGWPKEMNPKDDEATARFRRRVEKDDIWPIKMRKLLEPMERFVLQNNAVNIYENFFDDMVMTELVLPLYVRTVNVYEDTQSLARPITHLSWSPDHGKRLAVSYCSREFERDPIERNPWSYIWEIENPNEPFMALKAFCPSVTIEFNPRDPSMLISGLLSGQVCNWDIRVGDKPVQMSHLQFSHRNPTNLALWINSKTNTEFFSASTGGAIKWWDLRKLREPTETLVMDLENPSRADAVRAIGVCSLHFEPTMGTKFMAGMENGTVVSGTRKGKNPQEKLAQRFACHAGPVIAIDRNPFSAKNFLTVGGWVARIWAEDTKEGTLISIKRGTTALTGGCWSSSRCSVFYLIDESGAMKIYDLLAGLDSPVKTIRLCENGLRAIAPHEDGELLAVGSEAGNVYLVEASEALTTNVRNDKSLTIAYLERCSRYVKAVDNRLKELRLVQRISHEMSEEPPSVARGKPKRPGKDSRGKELNANDTKADEKSKLKAKKAKELVTPLAVDPELDAVQARYYEVISKEREKYAEIAALEETTDEGENVRVAASRGVEARRKKPEDSKVDKEMSGAGAKRLQLPAKRDELERMKGRKSRAQRLTRAESGFEEIVVVRKTKGEGKPPETEEKRTTVAIDEDRSELERKAVIQDRGKELTEDETKILKKLRRRDESSVKIRGKAKKRRGEKIKIKKVCTDYVCRPDICCADVSARRSQEMSKKEEAPYEASGVESETQLMIDKMLSNLPRVASPEELGHLLDPTDDEKNTLPQTYERPTLLDESARIARREARQCQDSIIRREIMRSIITSQQCSKDEKKLSTICEVREKPREVSQYVSRPSFEKISDIDEESDEFVTKVEDHGRKVEKVPGTSKGKVDCEPIGVKFGDKEIKEIIGMPDAPKPPSRPKFDGTKPKITKTKETYPRISAAALPAFKMDAKKLPE